QNQEKNTKLENSEKNQNLQLIVYSSNSNPTPPKEELKSKIPEPEKNPEPPKSKKRGRPRKSFVPVESGSEREVSDKEKKYLKPSYSFKFNLIDKPWQDAIIEYLSNPFAKMQIRKLCEKLGIHSQTYYKFLRDCREEIFKEVERRRKKNMSELSNDAYKALAVRMWQSDKALQMALEMTNQYIPRTEQKIEYNTPEQKKEKIRKFLEEISKRSGNASKDKQPEGDSDG
ncbi:MAG: hypothetical protein ABIH92_05225, partial [Nanoarchaeota archaeon]